MTHLLQVGSVYQHYKGNLYKIIACGRHSETHEEYVVYQALYTSEMFGDFALWVRPLNLFMELVEVRGNYVPRFKKVDDEITK